MLYCTCTCTKAAQILTANIELSSVVEATPDYDSAISSFILWIACQNKEKSAKDAR